jgi:hypothetical protein
VQRLLLADVCVAPDSSHASDIVQMIANEPKRPFGADHYWRMKISATANEL